MSWDDAMEHFGGGDLTFLSEDGEMIHFVVGGEPVLIEGKYRGKVTERGGVPIFTQEGFSLLVVGKRVVRKLYKYKDRFESHAFELVRMGEQNDTDTKYQLKPSEDAELTKELFAIAKQGFSPDELADAIKAAEDAAKG